MRAAPAASGWQVYAVCWEQYYGSCNPPCWSLGRWFWERFLTRLGKKKSVRLAARQLNAFRRVSEMGIKPMNSAAWRAGAPPTGMCRHRRATAAPCKILRMPFVLQQKMLDGGKRRSLCHKSAAGFPWKSVDGSQALEKFLVFRLFADRVNVGGDDPNRHPAFCAGNQQVDNQFMMRRLLPGKGKKADQQLRIQQIPFEIGEPEARR